MFLLKTPSSVNCNVRQTKYMNNNKQRDSELSELFVSMDARYPYFYSESTEKHSKKTYNKHEKATTQTLRDKWPCACMCTLALTYFAFFLGTRE